MLGLRKLELEDFGPFKGRQSVQFPATGVTLIFGENMRGKTSLLNATRFALFGKVIGRGSRELSLSGIGNWEAADEGRFGFKVVLTLDVDGDEYELTRQCRPRPFVDRPQGDSDYEQETVLRVNRNAVAPTERERLLARVMPEQVARFFLFDGELLQEYEELLRNESDMGRRISVAIERILGVPVLTNARADLRHILEDAQSKFARAASRSKEFEELGGLLENLGARRNEFNDQLRHQEEGLEDERQKKTALDLELRKIERIAGLLSELQGRQAELQRVRAEVDANQAAIQEMMSDGLRMLAGTRARSLRTQLEEHIELLRVDVSREALDQGMRRAMLQALDEGECPACLRTLDGESAGHLREELKRIHQSDDTAAEQARALEDLTVKVRALGRFDSAGELALMHNRLRQRESLQIQRVSAEESVREMDEQVRSHDQSEVRRLHSEHEAAIRRMTLSEDSIRQTRSQLDNVEEQIRRAEAKLQAHGSAELDRERVRAHVCQQLYEVFDSSIAIYRDRLRERVERDASELFKRLTTEQDYAGLKINQNYGLTIVHRDGRLIPVRSAGAEHVVALSLMGALQRNAPLRGPIIMDSPFGRLDEQHTSNIVRALPQMAEQVVLLVYRAELDAQTARNELGGSLAAEYHLVRESARHTSLQLRQGVSL